MCVCVFVTVTLLSPHTLQSEQEKSAKQEKDELLMAALLEDVLPKAASLYMEGPLQVAVCVCMCGASCLLHLMHAVLAAAGSWLGTHRCTHTNTHSLL